MNAYTGKAMEIAAIKAWLRQSDASDRCLPNLVPLNFTSRAPNDAKVIVLGPWFGEFGVQLARWVPYVRSLRQKNPNAWIVSGGYEDEAFLYEDIVDEYWAIDVQYRQQFKNAETPNNYGTLPALVDNYGVRKHEQRKGFPNRTQFHMEIAHIWLSQCVMQFHGVVQFECSLGHDRVYSRLRTKRAKRIREAYDKLSDVDSAARPLIMLLPRARIHQGALRSWPRELYERAAETLIDSLNVNVAFVGSALHEPEQLSLSRPGRMIDLSHAGAEAQIAYWCIAGAATGPLSGGLVPAYFTNTKPIFWYRDENSGGSVAETWPQSSESSYSVLGILGDWVSVHGPGDCDNVRAFVERALSRRSSC